MLTARLDVKPWYLEPWPWLLIMLPTIAVVAGFITLALAIRSADGLVANEYYKEGMAINRELAREQQAAKLHIQAKAIVPIESGIVQVQITSLDAMPAALSLHLAHPTRDGLDKTILLKAMPGGWYEGRIDPPSPARWQLILEDAAHTWRINGHWNTTTRSDIEFPTH